MGSQLVKTIAPKYYLNFSSKNTLIIIQTSKLYKNVRSIYRLKIKSEVVRDIQQAFHSSGSELYNL